MSRAGLGPARVLTVNLSDTLLQVEPEVGQVPGGLERLERGGKGRSGPSGPYSSPMCRGFGITLG